MTAVYKVLIHSLCYAQTFQSHYLMKDGRGIPKLLDVVSGEERAEPFRQEYRPIARVYVRQPMDGKHSSAGDVYLVIHTSNHLE